MKLEILNPYNSRWTNATSDRYYIMPSDFLIYEDRKLVKDEILPDELFEIKEK